MSTPKVTKKKVAKKKAAAKPAPAGKATGHRITVTRDGFRRLGQAWYGTTLVPPGELSADDIAVLEADPMFVVVPVSGN